jgi:predicted dehydrogenase/threonine dehydrogenase-like Zn-dependent dehydrogenase
MKQLIQYQKTGKIIVENIPIPNLKNGWVLIRNSYSLISSGTEKASVETAQASIYGKARTRPDLVKQVVDNIHSEGIYATYKKVKTRLDNYKELGYSCVGRVIKSTVDEFKPSDRVCCSGLTANHAEVVSVPKHLIAKVPKNVSDEQAVFTTLATIALQGVRQANVRIGETVVVVGLGLIGLITVQLLRANGCKVIGLDINEKNFYLAKQFGCDVCIKSNTSSIRKIESITNGYGTDAVIITASTRSSEPVEMAIQYSRKKGKIVVVGAVGMDIPRSSFYEKELEFTISCSLGPGRYDNMYEEKGIDYPYAYVRWTENRNMQAVLDLLANNLLNFQDMISHRINIDKGVDAYDLITGKKEEDYLGIIIQYPEQENILQNIFPNNNVYKPEEKSNIVLGFIGPGNFAQSNLLPNIDKNIATLKTVVASRPINAKSAADKFNFHSFSTDPESIFTDDDINTIFISTRHDSHAEYVMKSLIAGKNVFVEKPLAIKKTELSDIKELFVNGNQNINPYLMVGFNRRFSEPFTDIKEFFKDNIEPFIINYRVNAGVIPADHWIQEPGQGGRIIGEGCHFIDCMQFITGARPIRVYTECVESPDSKNIYDNVNISIKFTDGSIGTLSYVANGAKRMSKEYMEVFSAGKSVIMDNFEKVIIYDGRKAKKNKYNGKKGHKEEIQYFLNVINGTLQPTLFFDEIYFTTLTSIKAVESIHASSPIDI